MRLRLDLGYDGSGFHGWAAQTGLRTVQGELELWIQRVLRLQERPELVVAGRTDAGVHARGQVAHLDLTEQHGLRPFADDPGVGTRNSARRADERREEPRLRDHPGTQAGPVEATAVAELLLRRLRRALPEDIAVFGVRVAEPGFDARFSAIWRRYIYRLTDAVPDPILRNQVAAVRVPLDVDAINDSGAVLLGLHDFTAFCRAREGATTVRELQHLRAERTPAGHIAITVRADAFCHSMVRSLVGALVEVGTGRRDAAWLAGLLDVERRSGEIPVMPAHGLVLEEVGYPASSQLAARATEARARRELPVGNRLQSSRASSEGRSPAGARREEDV